MTTTKPLDLAQFDALDTPESWGPLIAGRAAWLQAQRYTLLAECKRQREEIAQRDDYERRICSALGMKSVNQEEALNVIDRQRKQLTMLEANYVTMAKRAASLGRALIKIDADSRFHCERFTAEMPGRNSLELLGTIAWLALQEKI